MIPQHAIDEAHIRQRSGVGQDAVAWGSPAARWILVATVLASGMAFLDATVVNVALPTIGAELDASVAGLQWILSGYTLTLASLILIGGALGDRFGRRRVFLVGTVWFAAASLLCGLAPTLSMLVAARALQGVGGAFLTPGSLAIIQASFASRDRARAVGAWSGLAGVAAAIGPFIGGWLIGAGSWRLIFLINLPLAAVVAMASRHVPETRNPSSVGGIDVAGAGLITAGLAGVTWALIEGGERGASGAALAVGAAGLAALAGFVAVERRASHPMLPLDIFRSRQFTAANLVTFAVYAGMGMTFFLLVVNFQQLLGYSPMQAGVATLPITALMLALSARAGMLADRIGPRLPDDDWVCRHGGRARAPEPRAGRDNVPRHRPAGPGGVRPRADADRGPVDRDRACRRRDTLRRSGVGRQQCRLARGGTHRDRGDSRVCRTDWRSLPGPGRFRGRISYSHAGQRDTGRHRCGAGVSPHSQRASRPRRFLPGGQARSTPLLRCRRRAAGHQARCRGGDALRRLTSPFRSGL
jgi:MFS family permease